MNARMPNAIGPETTAATTDGPLAVSGTSAIGTGGSGGEVKAPSSSTWIGASAEGDMLPLDTRDTFVGVWVDVPDVKPAERPPMDLALVVDTSGSMSGAKIENARNAASMLVRNMKEGDLVSLDAFSDQARTVVPPTRIDATSRAEILRKIDQLTPTGGTNMFAGLTLAEAQVSTAPSSFPLRRVVLISDGIANVGPSSPEMLGAVAERGLARRVQVTSLGVGNDYDERTLNALSIRSNGRIYHLSEPREMASILDGELKLLDATMASEAFVEVVAAPGVEVLGADGLRAEFDGNHVLRIPLGSLYAGQHKEALVRVRIDDPGAFQGKAHSLASVRLRFRDAQESDLERVQETIAHAQLTTDSAAVAKTASSRTRTIVAMSDAAHLQIQAAQQVNDGQFVDADKELASAQRRLEQEARTATAPAEKKRLEVAASAVASSRASVQAAPSKPKAAQREDALKLNAQGMHMDGF